MNLKVKKSTFYNTETQKEMFMCFGVLTNPLKSIRNKTSNTQNHKHRITEKCQVGTFSKQTHATLPQGMVFLIYEILSLWHFLENFEQK